MAINIDYLDEEIKIAKSELSGSAVDFKKAFDLMDAKIEHDICEIEEIVSGARALFQKLASMTYPLPIMILLTGFAKGAVSLSAMSSRKAALTSGMQLCWIMCARITISTSRRKKREWTSIFLP